MIACAGIEQASADAGVLGSQIVSDMWGAIMATTNATNPATIELWTVLKKEITGIQLLWETVNGLYFQPQGKEWQLLMADAPLLVHLMQTGLMESLLMRVSRMMDPATTGKLTNLSLKQLVNADASIEADEKTLRAIWD